MNSDQDIKIVGDKPSVDVKRNRLLQENGAECTPEQISQAKALGKMVAVRFLEDASDNENSNNTPVRLSEDTKAFIKFSPYPDNPDGTYIFEINKTGGV